MAKFLIAGAGIAGLSAALALAKSHHQITIIEQANELSEIGAGIQLGPNAMRILMDWGLDEAILDKGCEPTMLIVRDARNDKILTQRRLDDARQKYNAPYVCIRRADLQSVLQGAALAAGVELHLGESFEPSLAYEADAVLGCDGLHSKMRGQVLQGTKHAGEPKSTGYTAYRAMLDMSALPLDLRHQSAQVWLGAHQHVVAYPVNTQQLNIVIAQTSEPTLAHPMSAQLHALIAAVQSSGGFTAWPLFFRSPMWGAQFYAKDKAALLGDAAHPMLPYLAQGAAMAIEDAAALGQVFQQTALVQPNIHMALQAYAKARWKRSVQVQLRSQFQGYAFHASGLTRLLRDAVLQVAGARITDMPWLYSYQSQ